MNPEALSSVIDQSPQEIGAGIAYKASYFLDANTPPEELDFRDKSQAVEGIYNNNRNTVLVVANYGFIVDITRTSFKAKYTSEDSLQVAIRYGLGKHVGSGDVLGIAADFTNVDGEFILSKTTQSVRGSVKNNLEKVFIDDDKTKEVLKEINRYLDKAEYLPDDMEQKFRGVEDRFDARDVRKAFERNEKAKKKKANPSLLGKLAAFAKGQLVEDGTHRIDEK